jgi:hypothetical protein
MLSMASQRRLKSSMSMATLLVAEQFNDFRQQNLLLRSLADSQSPGLLARKQVGEQSSGVFVEMQERPALPVEEAALLLLQLPMSADFAEKRFQEVQSVRSGMLHWQGHLTVENWSSVMFDHRSFGGSTTKL